MKKNRLIPLAVFLIGAILSCTPEKVMEDFDPNIQGCCGEDIPTPPPPTDSIPPLI